MQKFYRQTFSVVIVHEREKVQELPKETSRKVFHNFAGRLMLNVKKNDEENASLYTLFNNVNSLAF